MNGRLNRDRTDERIGHGRPSEPDSASDRAVSSLVVVLMMVAITLVLAAMIAPPLYDTATNPTNSVRASATAEFERAEGEGNVRVAYVDNIDADYLDVEVTVQTDPGANSASVVRGSRTLEDPGDSVEFREDPGNADEDIQVLVTVIGIRDQERAVVLQETGTI